MAGMYTLLKRGLYAMEGYVQYISELDQFRDSVFSALESPAHSEVLISGTYDRVTYETVVNKIIQNNYAGKCRIIVPYISGNKGLSKTSINQIYKLGGAIKVNSSFNNSFVIIGQNLFIVSFSYKYNREKRLKSFFEGCVSTNNESTVEKLRGIFNDKWSQGFPLIAENV